jgi:D-serine deaminase-like pyridoxal phosphate-dependent protein
MTGNTDQITGIVTLTNTKQYPFNNSVQTIALQTSRDNQAYTVQIEVVSSKGEAGEIIISDRAVNGFKIAFSGSAKQAVIRYYLTGGLENDND